MWAERNSSTTEQSNEVDEWVNLNSAECGDVAGFEADAETVLHPAAWPSLPIGFDLVNEFEQRDGLRNLGTAYATVVASGANSSPPDLPKPVLPPRHRLIPTPLDEQRRLSRAKQPRRESRRLEPAWDEVAFHME